MPIAADALLRRIVAARGDPKPSDRVDRGDDGSGGTATIWKLDAAQTLVVADAGRARASGGAFVDAFVDGGAAAAASLATLHATAARPLFAHLACAGPSDVADVEREAWLAGAVAALDDAGASATSARWVDAATSRLDVVATGIVRPDRLKRAVGAVPGDALVLVGRLGTGILAAAHARGRATAADRDAWRDEATRTRAVGIAFGTVRNVHAVVAVGGDGLISAVLAIVAATADGAATLASIQGSRVAALPRAIALARVGCVAPDAARNWNRDGARVELADDVMPELRALLTDPHAGGALLVACAPQSVDRVVRLCEADGDVAAPIGTIAALATPESSDRKPPRLAIAA